MALKGKKPLEKAMNAKKASQTKNVKKLTTSDDAYSPEKRFIEIRKKRPKSETVMMKATTDWSNLKDETSKAKERFTKAVGRPTSARVLKEDDLPQPRKRRLYAGEQPDTVPPKLPRKQKRSKYAGGGRTRLLEELGRVEAEPSNRNRRAEISRVHSELNKGYKGGGAVLKGKKVGCQIK